ARSLARRGDPLGRRALRAPATSAEESHDRRAEQRERGSPQWARAGGEARPSPRRIPARGASKVKGVDEDRQWIPPREPARKPLSAGSPGRVIAWAGDQGKRADRARG